MLSWLAFAALVGVGVALAIGIRLRASAKQRLAGIKVSAEDSMSECRTWKATVEEGLAAAISSRRWIPREDLEAWLAVEPTPSQALREFARRAHADSEARQLLAYLGRDHEAAVESANQRILREELSAQRTFFEAIEKKPLTDEQATAVVTFDNRVQVIAAAGSGKTSVMVARAAYAILRGFVPADRILLLAFNRDAANELQQRVDDRLAAAGLDSSGIRASTFHAFGLSVIGKATGQKRRTASWLDGGQDLPMVSQIVDELRKRSRTFRFKWDIYRLLFARMSDSPTGGTHDSYDYEKKQTGFRTLNGEIVKSQGERAIADFLFTNGVKYEYERQYSHNVADAEHSQYRPDFYYPDIDVWHEHWGLDRDGNAPTEFKNYAQDMQWKKDLHRRYGTTLIETTWAAIVDQSGFQPLATALMNHGLELDWNPDRPARGAKPVPHREIASLMRSFMTHVKSNSLTPSDLRHRLANAPTGVQRYRAQIFLDLYWEVHEEWQRQLAADDSIDYEDMLVEAASYLESGIDMGFDLICADEFQDASQARARLTRALVSVPNRYLLAVGDDWQSINRFAGADISVMTSFADIFGRGPTLRLQTSFRSTQAVCDTASEFVAKNPRQLRKSVKSVQPDYGSTPTLVSVGDTNEVKDAVAKVLGDLASRVRSGEISPGPSGKVEVDVLGRYRFDRDVLPKFLPPELKVRFGTIHSSKGLEADFVVLPNNLSGTYGFPSEVVDDPVLSLAMSEADPYPHAEERRLMYVALTRARRDVTLIGVRGRESTFMAELLKDGRLDRSPLSSIEDSESCPSCGRGVLVVRKRRSDQKEFMACSTFPACSFSRSIDANPF